MKLKLFLYLLCAAMTLMLAGCGKEKEELTSQPEAADTTVPETETETETEETTAETKKTTKPAAETTAAASETTADTETSTAAETETASESQTETETAAEEPEVTETEPPAEETDAVVEETTEAPPVTEPDTAPAAQFSAEDLAFQYNGVSLTVGQDAAGFVAAVPADTMESAPSCYGNGSDVNYYYSNFTLYIWDSEGKQLTYGIDITGAGLTTSKGIGIGSSLADVTAAYGSGCTVEGPDYVYAVDDCTLRFTISGDAVTYISYNYDLG